MGRQRSQTHGHRCHHDKASQLSKAKPAIATMISSNRVDNIFIKLLRKPDWHVVPQTGRAIRTRHQTVGESSTASGRACRWRLYSTAELAAMPNQSCAPSYKGGDAPDEWTKQAQIAQAIKKRLLGRRFVKDRTVKGQLVWAS